MAVYIRRMGWVDFQGNVRTSQLTGNATMAAVQAQLQLLSNADTATESEALINVNPSPAPVNAPLVSVLDYAELWFQTTVGTTVTLTIPSPQIGIFMSDQQTVNPASVAGLVASAIGVLTSLAGDPVIAFIGGIRRFGQP